MQDLRKLPIADRRALAEEAKKRRLSGDSPAEICSALNLSPTTYNRWAQLFGFRQCDLSKDKAANMPSVPSGLRAEKPTGRFMLDHGLGARQPGSGRPASLSLEREDLQTPGAVLAAIEAALQASDTRRADRLIAAWRGEQRRAKALADLLQAAVDNGERDPPIPFFDPLTGEGKMTMEWVKTASDDALRAYILRVSGETLADQVYAAGKLERTGMAKFYLLTGCSGGGKSTTLSALAALGQSTIVEPGRRLVELETTTGGDALPWLNPAKFAEQAFWIAASDLAESMRQIPDARPVFCDRGLVDAAVALERLGVEPAKTKLSDFPRYESKVFLFPPWRQLFASDAERRHSFEDACAEFDAISSALPLLGYQAVAVHQGSVEARAEFILDTVRADLRDDITS